MVLLDHFANKSNTFLSPSLSLFLSRSPISSHFLLGSPRSQIPDSRIAQFMVPCLFAIFYSNSKSLKLFCKKSGLNAANFTERVFFRNSSQKYSYTSAIRDKFCVCCNIIFFWKSHVWGLRHLSPVVPIVSDCWLCNLACFVVFKDPRHRGLFFSHFENFSLCGVVNLWARGLPLFMILIFDFETFYWSGVRMHMYIIDFDCIFLFQSL